MKTNKEIIVAPSILSADFSNLERAIEQIEESGADWVHLDVMDGHFVPNLTFGPKMVKDLRKLTQKTFDVHLMMSNPDDFVQEFAQAGSDIITFHYEAVTHVHRSIQNIKNNGVGAGISIVPSTPVDLLKPILTYLDLVLIMGVNPGFGGQSFIPESLEKIKKLYELKIQNGFTYKIAIDGGVNSETVEEIVKAGADVLISGSAFFKSEKKKKFVQELKGK